MNDYKVDNETQQNRDTNTDDGSGVSVTNEFMSLLENVSFYDSNGDYIRMKEELDLIESILIKQNYSIESEIFPYLQFYDIISRYIANMDLKSLGVALIITNAAVHSSQNTEYFNIFPRTNCFSLFIQLFLETFDYFDVLLRTFSLLVKEKEYADFLLQKLVFDRIEEVLHNEDVMNDEHLFNILEFLAQLTFSIDIQTETARCNSMTEYFSVHFDPGLNGLAILDQCSIGLSNLFRKDASNSFVSISSQYDMVKKCLDIISHFAPINNEESFNITNSALYILSQILSDPPEMTLQELDEFESFLNIFQNCAMHIDQNIRHKSLGIITNLLIQEVISPDDLVNEKTTKMIELGFEIGNFKFKNTTLGFISTMISASTSEIIKAVFNPHIVELFAQAVIDPNQFPVLEILQAVDTLFVKSMAAGIFPEVSSYFQTSDFNDFLHDVFDEAKDEETANIVMKIVHTLGFDQQ